MALPAAAIASGAAPVVYRNIGDPSFWLARPSRRWRVRQYLRRVAHVVALWSGARDYYVDMGFPADRITVIPNGVDADLWPAPIGEEALAARRALGLDPGEPIVAFVGALGREKNVGLALAAMERLPDARLVVVGDGPEEHLVRQAMASGRRVSHLAAREDVRPVYLASDVLLSTSRSEGMPGVIIEAALTERPAVATAVGAVPDMIEDGLSGFVLADFDAETLADAVLRVLADGPDRGLTARQLALQRFDLRRLANEWVDLVGRLSK
jgi:glycosyltransferase involved in cell wall biosynthesis